MATGPALLRPRRSPLRLPLPPLACAAGLDPASRNPPRSDRPRRPRPQPLLERHRTPAARPTGTHPAAAPCHARRCAITRTSAHLLATPPLSGPLLRPSPPLPRLPDPLLAAPWPAPMHRATPPPPPPLQLAHAAARLTSDA
nr:proline-rich protein 36-like [Aegilops tauschii subsp. strangulata]